MVSWNNSQLMIAERKTHLLGVRQAPDICVRAQTLVARGRATDIFSKARELVEEERFLNWQVAFPGVWSNWESARLTGGFDAVIGNPPWDRIKLQEVEWWAARRPKVARAETAAKRKGFIKALEAVSGLTFLEHLLSPCYGNSISRGPKGERRPADVIGNAVKVMRIAIGDEPEDYGPAPDQPFGDAAPRQVFAQRRWSGGSTSTGSTPRIQLERFHVWWNRVGIPAELDL